MSNETPERLKAEDIQAMFDRSPFISGLGLRVQALDYETSELTVFIAAQPIPGATRRDRAIPRRSDRFVHRYGRRFRHRHDGRRRCGRRSTCASTISNPPSATG